MDTAPSIWRDNEKKKIDDMYDKKKLEHQKMKDNLKMFNDNQRKKGFIHNSSAKNTSKSRNKSQKKQRQRSWVDYFNLYGENDYRIEQKKNL
jgi:hypothetical protein